MAITAPITTIDLSHLHARSWTSPSGIDRAISRIGVALFSWAEARATRTLLRHALPSHENNASELQMRKLILRRELDAIRLTQRIGF